MFEGQTAFQNKNTLSFRFRSRRMRVFEDFVREHCAEKLNRGETIRILDLGGTYLFWTALEFKYLAQSEITLVNVSPFKIPDNAPPNVSGIQGDATNLPFIPDRSYDVAFSNSCIEHVGRKPEWEKMAREMMRIGQCYFLQTPNQYFPIDPHGPFVPLLHLMPTETRIFVLRHLKSLNITSREQAIQKVNYAHMLTYRDLRALFPNGTIWRERFMGLTKSFIIYGDCE